MGDHDLLPISSDEMAQLIRQSARHAPLDCAFGRGGVAVRVKQSPWAVPLIRQWRGIDYENGGGI